MRGVDAEAVADQAERIERDGYTVVADAIDADLVDALNDDLLRLEQTSGTQPAVNSFEGPQARRLYDLLADRSHLFDNTG